jgi:hypothetical protein
MPTPAQALRDIRGYAAAGRIEYTAHALEEMAEAQATFADVRWALTHATRAVLQANGRWKVRGPDRVGDDLALVVVLDEGVLVVTVF